MTDMLKSYRLQTRFLLLSAMAITLPISAFAATGGATKPPSLIITSDPLPESLKRQIYSKPYEVRSIKPSEVMGDNYYQPTQTIVSGKISELTSTLGNLQNKITGVSASLSSLERANEELAAQYYSNVATINTQLQSGTTPGNPRLVNRLSDAESQL